MRIRDRVKKIVEAEDSRPLSVAIVGQTGVGKSSLLNALFGTELEVGDITPTTKEPEPVRMKGERGHEIVFWDMPGFGESATADRGYLELYRTRLTECDVVLWALHADSRSVTYDLNVLERLLDSAGDETRRALVGKLTLVLTKVDMLAPPPWIFAKDRKTGFFAPGPELAPRITAKADYFEEVFLAPYAEWFRTRTYDDCGFSPPDGRFETTPGHVIFNGYLTGEECETLSREHPEFSKVFSRLRDNCRVICCSANFRYGLVELLGVVVNKIDLSASGRFRNAIGDMGDIQRVSVSDVRSAGTIVVWDTRRDRKVFDFRDVGL
ncbi:GTPase family protein [Streptomyces sp. ST2-7A]|uniref:GTPase family protein n=1 Tax=Streptomyces sp. ST2-7A TaxID=2907214 RepID=UPI001F1E83C7|nr:GTPase [Streptomyces sp. ST2-7A]MCE7083010.1 50S ribosome-binding GTPase [Streptomyces sp. ST2-7A]